ncbi:MAG TPA: hypothetical protein VMU48_17930 [Terracidiphilus sp.]|nr:hypothetical protein [Terracidiphilus sp.]
MAFGIDDALAAAAAGISLTDTCVKTIRAYKKKGERLDIELLIQEVRVTALRRIDEADLALFQLEHTLAEKGVNIDKTLEEVISETSFWLPWESHRLKRIRKSFSDLAEAVYSAIDDIASLVRCCDQTGEMGIAVVESARDKHRLQSLLLDSKSVRASIQVLRAELLRNKAALM